MLLERLLRLQVPRRLLGELAAVSGAVVVCDLRGEVRRLAALDEVPRCLVDDGAAGGAVAGGCLVRERRVDGWFACVAGAGEHRALALAPAAVRLGWVVTGRIDRAAVPLARVYHVEQLLRLLALEMDAFLAAFQRVSNGLRVAREDARRSFLLRRAEMLDGWERAEMIRGLERTSWNVARLANDLHLSKRAVFARIAHLQLVRPLS